MSIYTAPIKNTPEEHGQRPQQTDIVAVGAYRDDFDPDNPFTRIFITFRDGADQRIMDVVDQYVDDQARLPGNTNPGDEAHALIDLLADLPLGMLDRFALQCLGLPTT